ncbi:MAG TPA: SDR family oxidoreductase [Chitinophagaceae bacterium]|nr:SDR family oxidoreductase [Chitinophagaceae bacterium]
MNNILLAGATGYLGSYILKGLLAQNIQTKVLVRHPERLPQGAASSRLTIIKAELTKPAELQNCCAGINTVISTVGITRQKDGLTYMDVDYQANLNLLDEALKAGVKKFIYVSVLHGQKLRGTKLGAAKEKFVDAVKASGIDYCIIRPNGYFSDMKDFLSMAKSGRAYLFGNGENKMNPIHGEDLAAVCIKAVELPEKEINIGGPQLFTLNQIAALALETLGKPVKIIHLPGWLRKMALGFMRTFLSSKTYGPVEFFLTAMVMNMAAPQYGTHTLKQFFEAVKATV